MKAIIMAGGKGSRLAPLTNNKPKSLMPILDKPIFEYILELLKKYKITEISVTLGYLANAVIATFGDGKKYGVNLKYFIEKEPLGTAGGVKVASEKLKEDFLVMSGDIFTDFNLDELIDFHFAHRELLTIAGTKVEDPRDFGVMLLSPSGKVRAFTEKPLYPISNIASAGIYVMKPELLKMIPNGFCDFGRNVFPKLIGHAYCKVLNGYWADIGTLPSYYKTNYDISLNPSYLGL